MTSQPKPEINPLALDPELRKGNFGVPILSAEQRKRWDNLDALFVGALALQLDYESPDGITWSPELYRGDVNSCTDHIEENLRHIHKVGAYNRLAFYDSSMKPKERYIVHQAIADYLKKIGLYDAYMEGEVTKLMGLFGNSQKTLTAVDEQSWGVNIGYVPRSHSDGRLFYLRAEHRASDDLQGYRYSLAAFWHPSEKDQPYSF